MVDNADFTPSQVGGLFTFLARQLAKPDNTLFVNRKLFDQVTSSCSVFFWARPSSKQFQCLFSISDLTTSRPEHKNTWPWTDWFPNLDHTIESCLDLEEELEPLFSLRSSFQMCDVAQTQTCFLCLLTCVEINEVLILCCSQLERICTGELHQAAACTSLFAKCSFLWQSRVCAHKVFRLY